MQMATEHLAQHKRGEAEDVTAEKRRPEGIGHATAEQKGRSRGEWQRDDTEKVVGGGLAESAAERHHDPRRQRYECGPREVEAGRSPKQVGQKWVDAMLERVSPPPEIPHEHDRIAFEPDTCSRQTSGETASKE